MKNFIVPFLLIFTLPAFAQDIVIANVKIYEGPGSDPEPVAIRVTDGVITEFGTGFDASGAYLYTGDGGYITPGFIDSGSTLGLEEVGLSTKSEDQKYMGTDMSAGFDPLLAYNGGSSIIPSLLNEGVTHVHVRPEAGKDVFAGQGGLVSLSETGTMVSDARAVYVYLGEKGRDLAGESRAAALQRLVLGLDEAKLFASRKKAWESNRLRKLSFSGADLEVLSSVLKGEKKLVVNVDRAAEIEAVLQALDAYDINLILAGAREAWKVADAISSRGIPVILNVMDNRPLNFDRLGARLDQARLLFDAGIQFAFMSEYLYQESRMLSQSAGIAVAYGLPWKEALNAITINPARIWGIDDKLGALEVGKEGSFVIWDGDPLELTSRVTHIVIEGKFIEPENRQELLRDRYKTLGDDNNLPFSYR